MPQCEWQRDGDYALLTLPFEGKFNPDTLASFAAALAQVQADDGAKALIITGRDKYFAQGLDLDYLGGCSPDEGLHFVHRCMVAIGSLLRYPIPVVAAVNGHAFGLGAMITLASDYRVMRSERGYFCLPEVDLGMTLLPSMNALVCAQVPARALRDVLLVGERMGGERAAALGLIDAVCSPEGLLETARALARPMLGKPRHAVAGLKAGIHQTVLREIDSAAGAVQTR